jgi:hypothetical protein
MYEWGSLLIRIQNGGIHVIIEIFNEEEARTICQILLGPLLPKDQLIWRCTSNGEFFFFFFFFVRIAYC